jgi:hypothetical protein
MTLEESHFQAAQTPNSASLETSYLGLEGFKDPAGKAFSGRQNAEMLLNERQ